MSEKYANEVWKQISGYSRYMVSNMGRIKAKARIIKCKGNGEYFRQQKILTGTVDSLGYLHVRLINDENKTILWKIHQLVGKEFLNYDRKNKENIIVDHINARKTDNRLQNLRLLDKIQNSRIGCIRKAKQRRMPKEQLWYEDKFYIILNQLQGIKYFNHIIRDIKNFKEFKFTTRNRISFEEAIEQFRNIGVEI